MSNITRNSLVVAGVLAALMAGNVALASDVPTEVTLIEKQTLVRNNGAEVQSEQWICPYISRHLLSLNPLQARCRRYSRGER